MTSILKADRIQSTSNGFVLPPAGGIIQTQYLQYTSTTSTAVANGSNQTLDHLTLNITPTATNSIIKIEAMVSGEWTPQETTTYNSGWFFYRDSTKLAAPIDGSRSITVLPLTLIGITGADQASTPEAAVYSYFDTPSSTSQIAYKVGVVQATGSSATWYTNRTVTDTNSGIYERGISYISVTEIAG